MKTFIYCRKSSEDSTRQVLSIPSQESNLMELAERNKLVVHKIFRESMSAKKPGRPIFNELFSQLSKNPGSTLLVWKLDRLARNFIDGGQIITLLQQGVISCIMTPEKNYQPTDNVLLLAIEFGMANQYIRDLSTNVKRGINTKLEKGEFPGRPPFGYLNDRLNHTIIVDEKNKHWITYIYETYLTGKYGVRDIANLLYEKGLRTPSGGAYTKSHVHKILTNHFYYGEIVHNGKHYDGAHTPLISKQLFDRLQEMMVTPNRPRPKKRFYPLRGFLRCADCGCSYTADTKKNFTYYYCTNGKNKCEQHKVYLRSEKIHKLIAKTLKNIKFDREAIEIAFLAYQEKKQSTVLSLDEKKKQLINKQNIAQNKLLNLADVISTDTSMKDSLKPKIKLLEEEIDSIKTEIKQLSSKKLLNPSLTFEQIKKAFLQANSASFDYLKGDDNKKYELLNILLSNVHIANQKVQCFQFKPAFQAMALAPKNLSFQGWLGDVDSNHD